MPLPFLKIFFNKHFLSSEPLLEKKLLLTADSHKYNLVISITYLHKNIDLIFFFKSLKKSLQISFSKIVVTERISFIHPWQQQINSSAGYIL